MREVGEHQRLLASRASKSTSVISFRKKERVATLDTALSTHTHTHKKSEEEEEEIEDRRKEEKKTGQRLLTFEYHTFILCMNQRFL